MVRISDEKDGFPARFRKALEKHRLTPYGLSKLGMVSSSTAHLWTYSMPNSLKNLASVCKALDVSADYLLGLSEEEKTTSTKTN